MGCSFLQTNFVKTDHSKAERGYTKILLQLSHKAAILLKEKSVVIALFEDSVQTPSQTTFWAAVAGSMLHTS